MASQSTRKRCEISPKKTSNNSTHKKNLALRHISRSKYTTRSAVQSMSFQEYERRSLSSTNAMLLNNRAASSMEAGRYQEAIPILVKALKIAETCSFDHGNELSCKCCFCGLDYCVRYTQSQPRQDDESSTLSQYIDDDSIVDLGWTGGTTATIIAKKKKSQNIKNDNNNEQGYVHSRPILIPPQCMLQNHKMGLTLPLILTFNLALAHHFLLLSRRRREQQQPSSSSTRMKKASTRTTIHDDQKKKETRMIQKVLKLYEVTYRWQRRQSCDRQVDCIRFTLILVNNIAELYRFAGNHVKHNMCLQHLLSTLMFVMMCSRHHGEQRSFGSNGSSNDGHRPLQITVREVEGFFYNTSKLIMQNQCAGAA